MTKPYAQKVLLVMALCLWALPSAGSVRPPEDVACEEAKLGRLIHRFSSPSSGDNLFLWQVGTDRFSGLSVSSPLRHDPSQGLIRDERQLAFDFVLTPGGGLLNPRRSPLPQVSLVRRDAASNLSLTALVMSATFELAPNVIDPSDPQQGLIVAGRLGASFGSASGAGRALEVDNLFERCPGEKNSALDLQVFEILSRTLRISEALLLPFPSGRGLFNYKVIQ